MFAPATSVIHLARVSNWGSMEGALRKAESVNRYTRLIGKHPSILLIRLAFCLVGLGTPTGLQVVLIAALLDLSLGVAVGCIVLLL